MDFTSIEYIVFFFFVFASCLILQKINNKYKKYLLLAASYFFYAYWDFRFCLLLFTITVISYLAGKKSSNAFFYYLGIIMPIAALFFFKYFNFFLQKIKFSTINIVLPIGISFYCFEAISYVIDVHRGKTEAENDFVCFALYISFFVNILSGPIERASNLLIQIKNNRKISFKDFEEGIQIIVFGFFKKMVVADRIAIFVDDVFNYPSAFNSFTIMLAVLSYSIEIYADFSGYSDIAIGCAKCLGYDLKKNFDLPYISTSITEFWRRWHMSLSSWFKDFVYIPLGGNKKGKMRQYLNLLIVMLLSGLWHGANETFVAWGAINGILLCLEKLLINNNKSNNKTINAIRAVFVYLLISFTWIFFRVESLDKAVLVIKLMFSFKTGISQPYLWSFISFVLVIIATLYAIANSNSKDEVHGLYIIQDLTTVKGLTVFFVFIGLLLCLMYINSNPFIYFQF